MLKETQHWQIERATNASDFNADIAFAMNRYVGMNLKFKIWQFFDLRSFVTKRKFQPDRNLFESAHFFFLMMKIRKKLFFFYYRVVPRMSLTSEISSVSPTTIVRTTTKPIRGNRISLVCFSVVLLRKRLFQTTIATFKLVTKQTIEFA